MKCLGSLCCSGCRFKKMNESQYIEKLSEIYERRVVKNKEGCWGWKRKVINGYATITFFNKFLGKPHGAMTSIGAHRVSWIIHYGLIPFLTGKKRLFVCHKCDNPICTRPDHLFLGTAKDNSLDCKNKNRHFKGGVIEMPMENISVPKHISKRLPMNEFVSPGNQKKLREKLIDLAKSKRMSQVSLARHLGINPGTLSRFWKQELDVDFRTLSIIEAFIERNGVFRK